MRDEVAQKTNPELSGQRFLTKKVLSEHMQSYGLAHYPSPVKCRALGLRQCHSGLTPHASSMAPGQEGDFTDRVWRGHVVVTRRAMDDVL
jgi:hypothetical protein